MPTGERSKRRRRSASRGDLIGHQHTGGAVAGARLSGRCALFAPSDLGAGATTRGRAPAGRLTPPLLGSIMRRPRRPPLLALAGAIAALALSGSACVVRYAQVRRV